MRTSIIFLGLVALSFSTANATNEFGSENLDQQELTTLNVDSNEKILNCSNEVADTAIFNPSTVIKTSYVKTTEEVIAENKLITESKEQITQLLSIDFTLENRIAEDNQIIESTVSNVTYPLDFEKINRTNKSAKVYTNSAVVVDLKL
jgi:hypothetical protein